MPTITAVEPQKKSASWRTKRFNVFLDGKFAFGADEDLIVSDRLVVGKIIQPQGLDKLLYEVEVGKLMERMYGLFSLRSRSEKEVRDYLKNLSFKRKIKDLEEISEASIDLVIERLKQKEMLNDLEFAKTWVEGRRRSKQKSIRALRMELMKKGIDREIVEEVLSEPFDSFDKAQDKSAQGEEELAKQALEKKIKSWQNLEPRKQKEKALGFLMRKGFDYEVVKAILDKNRNIL